MEMYRMNRVTWALIDRVMTIFLLSQINPQNLQIFLVMKNVNLKIRPVMTISDGDKNVEQSSSFEGEVRRKSLEKLEQLVQEPVSGVSDSMDESPDSINHESPVSTPEPTTPMPSDTDLTSDNAESHPVPTSSGAHKSPVQPSVSSQSIPASEQSHFNFVSQPSSSSKSTVTSDNASKSSSEINSSESNSPKSFEEMKESPVRYTSPPSESRRNTTETTDGDGGSGDPQPVETDQASLGFNMFDGLTLQSETDS
eukprot:141750_1